MTIQDRIKLWREDAAVLRLRGARRAAALMERLAAELEDDMRGGATKEDDAPELVEMRAAVTLSGYTRGHLRRMLVAGTLTNYGTEARPLLRVVDLPRKPGRVRLPIIVAEAQ